MRRAVPAMIIVAATLALAGCTEEKEIKVEHGPRSVIAIQVGSADFMGERSYPGRARAAREASLSFRFPGSSAGDTSTSATSSRRGTLSPSWIQDPSRQMYHGSPPILRRRNLTIRLSTISTIG